MPGPFVDEVYTQPPNWTGREFATSEPFATVAEAREYATNLMRGDLDPFLGRAWTEVRIAQNRDDKGRYLEGFTVKAKYNRPGPGEDS